MTLELTRPTGPVSDGPAVQWLSPESGLWVASSNGEFLGMIERRDGRYVASDSRGRGRGSFDGLAAAQIAIDRMPDQVDRDRREVLMLRATVALTSFAAAGSALGLFLLAT